MHGSVIDAVSFGAASRASPLCRAFVVHWFCGLSGGNEVPGMQLVLTEDLSRRRVY